MRAKHNAHGYQEGDNEREIDANQEKKIDDYTSTIIEGIRK